MIIPLDLGEQSYDITVSRGALNKAGELLNLDRRVLVVTDSGVPSAYAETVAAQCKCATVVCIPQGEQSKNLASFEQLLKAMLDGGFTRKDCVVAVGGGVVGDLSGFAAACYMRGIDFYNIPTTLLSQVDSSIGGKTAVDFGGVKNIVGAFFQPKAVIVDPDTLKTLDPRQISAGLAEAIKMSLTSDAELFSLIESSTDLDADIEEIIRRALIIKRDVVQKDPKEMGLRKILNFGHTVGHAIESANGGALFHGECVALGMLPMCSDAVRERLLRVLKKYNLPCEIKDNAETLLPYITHDKKMQQSGVTAVTVKEIGSFELVNMTAEQITEKLK